MARYRGTTAERGLGSDHQADKRRLLALHRDGDPCWRCGQPMYKSQPLDRDHVVDRALGGTLGPAVLAHAACNRGAGATLGNQMQPRTITAAGRDTICRTCGKPYHYAAKLCEVCGVHYHPSGKEVRTCSRTCGVELRRRKYNGKQSGKPPAPSARSRTCGCPPGPHRCFMRISYRDCVTCGRVFVYRGPGKTVTCSAECRAAARVAYQQRYEMENAEHMRESARRRNDRLGEARGWPRGKGVYNVGKEPWNKRAAREW